MLLRKERRERRKSEKTYTLIKGIRIQTHARDHILSWFCDENTTITKWYDHSYHSHTRPCCSVEYSHHVLRIKYQLCSTPNNLTFFEKKIHVGYAEITVRYVHSRADSSVCWSWAISQHLIWGSCINSYI